MFTQGRTRTGRYLLISGLIAALAVGLTGPATQAAPTDPIGSLNHFGVDHTEQTATIANPGDSASLTTTMSVGVVRDMVDIVFVLDTTGSMSPRLATMAQGLAQFATNVAAAGGSDVAFGIYVFGDQDSGDLFDWAMPLTALGGTTTITDVVNTLTTGLHSNAGGDFPEDSLLAGTTIAANTPWRAGAQREEILVTDAASKIRGAPLFGGQPPTLATWQTVAANNHVNVSIVNGSGGTTGIDSGAAASTVTLRQMSDAFGSDATEAPVTAAQYTDLLTHRVVFGGTTPTYTIVPTLTVTYADGTPSTDLTATISPSVPTPVSVTPVSFALTATAAAASAITRPGETSTAYVEFTDQATGVIVGRQTITFATTAEQSVNVVFVDDDAAGAVVTPVAGFATTLTGAAGAPVGFTETLARTGIPAGYDFVSIDNVTTFPAAGAPAATITVHLRHSTDTDRLVTTRTVHYTGAGAATPPDNVSSITWTVTTDAVSHVATYSATPATYPAVTSPAVPGYTPDIAQVMGVTEPSPTTTRPLSTTVTVTYSATNQVVRVVFKDDDAAGALVTPVAGFVATLTGPSGGPVGFTQTMAAAGIPVGYVFASLDNVANYDTDASVDQTITVHLTHELRVSSVAPSRIIHYKGAGTATPPDKVQTITWTVTTDLVTGVTTYTTTATGYPAVVSPKLDGYTVDIAEVPVLAVVSPTTVEPKSVVVTVTYKGLVVQTGGTVIGAASPAPVVWAGLLLGALGLAGVGMARRRTTR